LGIHPDISQYGREGWIKAPIYAADFLSGRPVHAEEQQFQPNAATLSGTTMKAKISIATSETNLRGTPDRADGSEECDVSQAHSRKPPSRCLAARQVAYVKSLGTHAEHDRIDAVTVSQF
jgi:hypothetical protein